MTEQSTLLDGLRRTADTLAIQKMGGYEAWVSMAISEIVTLQRQVDALVALIRERNQLDPVQASDRLAEILVRDRSQGKEI
jgi:hypothetical protein